ncbi:hypothetical protein HKD37_14G040258 [Glycine soja]
MQRRSSVGDLIPIDLEINTTCRRRNQARIRKFLQDLEAVATPEEEPQSSEASSRCTIYGGAHESGCSIPIEEQATHEVNYMGNQPKNNFNGQWRNHPGNQFNRDQGRPSTRPQKQGPSLYDRTMKLEETLAQFMQKSAESAIKNLEVQVGQLAKQLADRSSSSFIANTEKNPKEECKAVMNRSRMTIQGDDNEAGKKMEEHKQQLAPKPTSLKKLMRRLKMIRKKRHQ